MPQVILQPTGNPEGRQHYLDTIETPIRLNDYTEVLDRTQYEDLLALHPDGFAGLWGVTPGGREVNVGKWNRIERGDVALFATAGQIHSKAVVTYKFHSPELARAAWGVNSEGQTWEYVYTVAEVQKVQIPYIDFNRAVGYEDNYIIQGFNVLSPDKSDLFLDKFGLLSNTYLPEVEESEFEEAVRSLDGPLDRQAKVWQRSEQGYARKFLLGQRSYGVCLLCGRQMIAEFLVAAHIKRRASCLDDEKRDLEGVMMLACRFGCDYLFEQGHIGVDAQGKLRVSPKLQDSSANTYLNGLKDREVAVREAQRGYFAWHWNNRFIP